MHLVDTSVWSDHLRRHDAALARLLDAGEVLVHPFVTGEIACCVFPRRAETLALLNRLPSAPLVAQAKCSASSTATAWQDRAWGSSTFT